MMDPIVPPALKDGTFTHTRTRLKPILRISMNLISRLPVNLAMRIPMGLTLRILVE